MIPVARTDHINETIAIFARLYQYSQNISSKIGPTMKRITPRIMEMIYSIDLSPECMASLVRIGGAINDGNLWALKCKNK